MVIVTVIVIVVSVFIIIGIITTIIIATLNHVGSIVRTWVSAPHFSHPPFY